MIEVGLAQNAPQRCLTDQRRCAHVIEHLDYRLFRIDYPEIDDRVDLHRHVVPSDGLLRWDLERDDAQIDFTHALGARDQQDQTWSTRSYQTAKTKDDAALVLLHDLDR